jgi:CheY-like chemotaxis protein
MNGTDKYKNFMLIADSNIDDRFQTGMILQQLGYTVITADSAEQALAIMSATPPAAVFTDAGETGMAILAGMKSSPFTADIPLIVASSTANAMLEGRMRRGLLAGVLVRPLDAEKVLQVVGSVVVKGSRRNIRAALALEAGLSGSVKLDKAVPFIGREALLAARDRPLAKRLLAFSFDDPAAFPWGGEPILADGESVGELTSVGYSRSAGRALALGYVRLAAPVDPERLRSLRCAVDIAGKLTAVTVRLA